MEDVFRKKYQPLTDIQKIKMEEVNELAEKLYDYISYSCINENNGREISVAKTNLETAIMWAVKGITK